MVAYTQNEIALLQDLWGEAPWSTIRQAIPNRTDHGLRQKAASLGLTIKVNRQRKGDLTPLLNDSLISWYWLGFILADGHITKTGQLTVTLNDKDVDHLQELANFVNGSLTIPYPAIANTHRLAIQQPAVCKAIETKLGLWSSNKTENPPNSTVFAGITGDNLNALFVGFFDGDGSSHKVRCGLVNHASWLPVYEHFKKHEILTGKITINKYVSASVSRAIMRDLAKFITLHNLPAMKRKWEIWS